MLIENVFETRDSASRLCFRIIGFSLPHHWIFIVAPDRRRFGTFCLQRNCCGRKVGAGKQFENWTELRQLVHIVSTPHNFYACPIVLSKRRRLLKMVKKKKKSSRKSAAQKEAEQNLGEGLTFAVLTGHQARFLDVRKS